MSRINAYPGTLEVDGSDRFIIDGTNGTRNITLSNLADNLLETKSVIDHRNTWRGKYLGTGITTEQNTAIANGSFKNLFVGDYWTINNHTWRIIDINYFYNTGDASAFVANHLVLTTDTSLYNTRMEGTDTTENGYSGSEMVSANLTDAIAAADTDFASYLAMIDDYRSEASEVDGETILDGSWATVKVLLPNEISIFGVMHGMPEYTILSQQFAGFRLNPAYANIRINYWTRDIASDEEFVYVSAHGGVDAAPASTQYGVRPIIVIKSV